MLPKRDNYAIQANDARLRFLTYDQDVILRTTTARADDDFLYLHFCCRDYRISRADGHVFRMENGGWQRADSHGEVMTIFDYLCDAKPSRHPAGEFVSLASLGNYVHTGLSIHSGELERAIDRDLAAFRRVCLALGGEILTGGDFCCRLRLFDDLPLCIRFWQSDEEFPPSMDVLWDRNTLDFLRYETTWFAAGVLRQVLIQKMALSD